MCEEVKLIRPTSQVQTAAPLAVLATLRSVDQVLQVLVLQRAVLLGRRQAEQRADPLRAHVQDGVGVAHLLKVPAQQAHREARLDPSERPPPGVGPAPAGGSLLSEQLPPLLPGQLAVGRNCRHVRVFGI